MDQQLSHRFLYWKWTQRN